MYNLVSPFFRANANERLRPDMELGVQDNSCDLSCTFKCDAIFPENAPGDCRIFSGESILQTIVTPLSTEIT